MRVMVLRFITIGIVLTAIWVGIHYLLPSETNSSGTGQLKTVYEKAEYFFTPQLRYPNYPLKEKWWDSALFQEDRFAPNLFITPIRPVGATINVPRNQISVASHPYMPWAKEIWDIATIELLLPNFEPRSPQNEKLFVESDPFRLLVVRIGWLSSELEHNEISRIEKRGYVSFTDRETNLVSFHSATDSKRSLAGLFYVAPKSELLTPSSNPVVFKCSSERQAAAKRCTVQFIVPCDLWPKEYHSKFGNVPGVEVLYSVPFPYLKDWKSIHSRVIDIVSDSFILPNGEHPNLSPRLNRHYCKFDQPSQSL